MYTKVKTDLMTARRNKDEFAKGNLTVLLAAFQSQFLAELKTDRNFIVPDEACLAILKSQIKSLKAGLEKSGAQALADQIAFLNQYLPAQLSEEEMRIVLKDSTHPAKGMPLINKYAADKGLDFDRALARSIIMDNANAVP